MPPFVPASLFATIVDHIELGIFVLDDHDRVVLWNDYMARHTGRQAAEVIGKNLYDEFADLPQEWLGRRLAQVREQGLPVTLSWRERAYLFRFPPPSAVRGDPDHMRQDCRLIPVGGRGGVEAVCVCITDVTEVSKYQLLLEQSNVQLRRDLELSAAAQSLVLPPADACTLPGVELAAFFRPSAQCGGDWWWYDVQQDGRLLIFVGDVTGHGTHAAMVTMAVASTFQTMKEKRPGIEVPQILEAMDGCLRRLGHYSMTMLVTEIGESSLRWWSAAAPPMLAMDGEGQTRALIGGGSMLGTGSRLDIGGGERSQQSGDRIMMFTDGAYEFPWKSGQFGLKRLKRLFGETRGMSLFYGKEHVSGSIALAGPHEDDITLVLVDVDPPERLSDSPLGARRR